jgi:TonB family protein
VQSLTVDELRAVLLHEQGHRRRWDTLRAALQRAVLAVFFFYPPAWWIVARLRASAEIACDESVLSRGVPPSLYSRALARVLATGLGIMSAIPIEEVGFEHPRSLLSRLDRIENAWRYRAMTKHRILAAVAVLVVIASLVVLAWPAATAKPHSENTAEPGDRFKALDRLDLDPDPIVVHFDRTPLSTVFKGLAKEFGIRIESLGTLSREVSITYSHFNAREILVRLAESYNLRYEVLDPHALLVQGGPLLPWGPLMPDNEKVAKPVLIPSSRVDPVYPAGPREEGTEANVILQAVIHYDGSVSDVQALRTNEPDLGFEEAAIEAVSQWRYEPALYKGVPVDVYFTIFVEFTLDSNKAN